MKKTILLTFLFVAIALTASGQNVGGVGLISKGLKFGLSMSNWTGIDLNGNETKTGFAGGGFVTLGISRQLALQPEIMYCMIGTQFTFNTNEIAKYKLNYLIVPVLLKYKFQTVGNVVPNFFAGPEVGILLSAKVTLGSMEEDFKDQLKNTDFGLTFGGGIDFKLQTTTLMIDARYTLGLSEIRDNVDDDDKLKNSDILTYCRYRLLT